MLEKLPLGQAHLMSFELIPLGSLRRLPGMIIMPWREIGSFLANGGTDASVRFPIRGAKN